MATEFDPLTGLQPEASPEQQPVISPEVDIERTVQAGLTPQERKDRIGRQFLKDRIGVPASGGTPLYIEPGGKALYDLAVREPKLLNAYSKGETIRNMQSAMKDGEFKYDGKYDPDVFAMQRSGSKIAQQMVNLSQPGGFYAKKMHPYVRGAIRSGGYNIDSFLLPKLELVMGAPYNPGKASGATFVDGLDIGNSAGVTEDDMKDADRGDFSGLYSARQRFISDLVRYASDEEEVRIRKIVDDLPPGAFYIGDRSRKWLKDYHKQSGKPFQTNVEDMMFLSGMNHRKKLAEVERVINGAYKGMPAQSEGQQFKDMPRSMQTVAYGLFYQRYKPDMVKLVKKQDMDGIVERLGNYPLDQRRANEIKKWVDDNAWTDDALEFLESVPDLTNPMG